METKIKEVVFFDVKESVKKLRKDIEKLNITKSEIVYNNFLMGGQIHELVLSDRQIDIIINSYIESIIEKLNEEVNKIVE